MRLFFLDLPSFLSQNFLNFLPILLNLFPQFHQRLLDMLLAFRTTIASNLLAMWSVYKTTLDTNFAKNQNFDREMLGFCPKLNPITVTFQ
jgi:hypothetical protein